MKIELDILFHTGSTESLSELGIDFDMRKCEIRKMMFYNINSISPYIDKDGREYCSIFSNSSEFISVHRYDTLKNLL